MIGRIRGTIIEKTPNMVLIDVAGVGYELEIPLSTFYELGLLDENVILHTQMVVREDAQLLYGFKTLEEREMFRSLVKVNGVGPKLAITILSGVSASDFVRCVLDGDVKSLVALPGVGKKTAERLIVEMKDRMPKAESLTLGSLTPLQGHLADAESALIQLGFKPQDASRALAAVDTPDKSVEDLIRDALKQLS
ncbi:MAG: Holliday junction branch migration protein RuvA [Pseudomonadales bacterium]|jgi:Holliday junction DNA helicase RuvA|nr:Holliday junction branch migration protein RuvA [Pseudomonadales bacterium]